MLKKITTYRYMYTVCLLKFTILKFYRDEDISILKLSL